MTHLPSLPKMLILLLATLGAVMLACSPLHAVGFCRDPDKCGKPEQKCDQAALDKAKQDYDRKEKTALELHDASEKTTDAGTWAASV